MNLRIGIALLAITGSLIAAAPAFSAEKRFTGVWVNGIRESAAELSEWHDPGAKPKLNNRLLLEGDPIRWVRDNTLDVPTPAAYVEFVGGDRLPGQVMEYRRGTESGVDQLPAHLIVQPDAVLDWPDSPPRKSLRVLVAPIARVVWQRSGRRPFQPGTLVYRDGRQVHYRSLRWAASSVHMLLDKGTADAAFSQIAELHLNVTDPWQVYFDEVATLSPDGAGRLMRVEATSGLKATTSLSRFQARNYGGGDPQNWIHQLQPAWSIDTLFVRHRTIALRLFLAPNEIPLSWFEPVAVAQKSPLGGNWRWQADRSSEGGVLRTSAQEFGWGLGVHAYNRLEFALPAIARSLRVQAALDGSVGTGGCVKARVYLGDENSPAKFETPILVGSTSVADSGQIALPESGTRVTLVADPVLEGRPAGADPLDIRDALDWLEPLVTCDAALLQKELTKRRTAQFASWDGWSVGADPTAVRTLSYYDNTDLRQPMYRFAAQPTKSPLVLSKTLSIDPARPWLIVAADRHADDTDASKLAVKVGNTTVGEADVTPRYVGQKDPDVLAVSLAAYAGSTVPLEIAHTTVGARSWVDWRGISFADRPPGLLPLFEDALGAGKGNNAAADLADLASQGASLDKSQPYTGEACLRVAPGRDHQARLGGISIPIRENPRWGEYRFLRFAWRKTGGGLTTVSLEHDGSLGADAGRTYTYDMGPGEASVPQAPRLYDQKPPEQWMVFTRDLYADFGNFTLTGWAASARDGKYAEIDHVYLGRNQEDFQRVGALVPGPPDVRRRARLLEFPPGDTLDVQARKLLSAFSPQFTVDTFGPGGLGLVAEHQGRKLVLRTAPPAPDKPSSLRATIFVPPKKKTQLIVSVSHAPANDWRFVALIDGKPEKDVIVGPRGAKPTAENDWTDFSFDLTRFAGGKVNVELQNHSNDAKNEAAFWSRIDVVSE